jgi:hypothetical protein
MKSVRVLPALLAVGVVVMAATAAPSLAGAPSPYYVPTPGTAFFSPSSVWNQELSPEAQIDPSSGSLVETLMRVVNTEEAGKYGPWISTNGYSTPVYTVPAEQPTTYVTLETPNPYLQSAFSAVPLPPEAQPAALSDGQLVVWQPSTDTMWEFWRLRDTATGWVAQWGGVMDDVTGAPGMYLPSSYPGARTYWGATGSGLPLVGGLITMQDLKQGHINHALAMGMPETQYKTWSWPAVRTDGPRVTGIPEGTHFRINPNLNLSKLNLPPVTRMLAEAAQRYGIIVRDSSGTMQFFAEEPTIAGTNPYPQLLENKYPWQLLASFPWSSLEVLKQQIDTEPPWTTITSTPPKLTNQTSATFTYTSSKPESVFECEIDTQPSPTECEGGSFTVNNLSNGWHLFSISAIDADGLHQPWSKQYYWRVDSVPPVTTILTEPPLLTNQETAQFTFSAQDSTATEFKCQLDGAGWSPCYSGVTYYDVDPGSHTFQVQATDAADNVEVSPQSYTWTVDTTPPVTTIASGPPAVSSSSSATFAVASSEPNSTIRCSLDGGAWQTCVSASQCELLGSPFTGCSGTVEFTGLAEGAHTLSVQATDAAGNQDATGASYSWTVDADPPVTSFTEAPSGATSSTSATFAFSALDSTASTFQCQIDGGPWFSCSSPVSLSGLEQGVHVFRVRATDEAGNVEPSPPTVTWTVDTTPPVTTIGEQPAGVTSSSSATFAFSATDTTPVTFQCRLDGSSWSPCTSPASYSSLGDGPHTFQVQATDEAGNVEPSPPTVTWTVDTDKPLTSLSTTPPALTNSTSASFVFSATDTTPVTFQCQLDDSGWSPCTSPASYSGLGQGTHTFQVQATDQAGNAEVTPVTYTWTVDTTPPVTTIGEQPAGVTSSSSATFAFSATDTTPVTFQCRLDDGGWSPCSSPVSLSGLEQGVHVFRVRATDEAGNVEPSPPTVTWTVDTTPPVTTITSGPTQGITRTPSASFQFASTEAGSTFRCKLDAAEWLPCSSPASYTELQPGSHTFSVAATDPAGNTDPHPPSTTFLVTIPSAFSPSSYLNAPLEPNAPLASESTQLASELLAQVNAEIAAHTGPTIVINNTTTDVYQVSPSVPPVKVGGLPKTAPPALVQALSTVPIPAGARPTSGIASQLTIWQPSSNRLWELRGVWKNAGNWYAAWGGETEALSANPGYFSPASWGATETAIPLLGGMVTIAELQSGRIEHALALQIPEPRANQWSWPAQRTNGLVNSAGAIPEGTRFRLNPSLSVASLNVPPVVRMLAEAAQHYGIVVRGYAPQVSFYAEEPNGTTNPYPAILGREPLWQQLSSFPWSSLQALPLALSP